MTIQTTAFHRGNASHVCSVIVKFDIEYHLIGFLLLFYAIYVFMNEDCR